MSNAIVIVGAGIAGLRCARRLTDAGRDVVVLEKSRGVGGRCATRRIEGQPVDHGVCFYHGNDPGFLDALRAVDSPPIEGWPRRIRGRGRPCQPRTLAPREERLAFAAGVTAFPKQLALGIAVRRETRVVRVVPDGARFTLRLGDGSELGAATLVLALPPAQASELLQQAGTSDRGLAGILRLLSMLGSAPCLTTIAGYERAEPEPEWDMIYPEDSNVLQLISHDSSKRVAPVHTVLVLQALPAWSRKNREEPAERWQAEMLAEARRLAGKRFGTPAWAQTHHWHYGTSTGADELAQPLWLTTGGGARLGVAGEVTAPGGGVQAAWRSGNLLADRILEDVAG